MHKKRILIVEDDEIIAEMEKEILNADGFEVEIARDGLEGLERIRSNGYSLIISDFAMPKMTGKEFYLEVKRLSQGLEKKIIFVSAIINDFIESTGNSFLAKPFSGQQLMQAVKDFSAPNETPPEEVKITLKDFILRAKEANIGKAIGEFYYRLPKIEVIEEKEDVIKAYVSTSEGGESAVMISTGNAFCSCRENFQYGYICKHVAVLIFHLITQKYSETIRNA